MPPAFPTARSLTRPSCIGGRRAPSAARACPFSCTERRSFGRLLDDRSTSIPSRPRRVASSPTDADHRSRVLAIEDELDETLGVDARLLGTGTCSATTSRRARPSGDCAVSGHRSSGAGRRRHSFVAHVPALQGKRGDRELAEARVRVDVRRASARQSVRRVPGGGSLTLADLTLAALASPLLRPPEHPVTGRFVATPIPELAAFRAELAATPRQGTTRSASIASIGVARLWRSVRRVRDRA